MEDTAQKNALDSLHELLGKEANKHSIFYTQNSMHTYNIQVHLFNDCDVNESDVNCQLVIPEKLSHTQNA